MCPIIYYYLDIYNKEGRKRSTCDSHDNRLQSMTTKRRGAERAEISQIILKRPTKVSFERGI